MKEKRYWQILTLLVSYKRRRDFVTVTELSKFYHFSTVTARKWLERARQDGFLYVVNEEYRNVPTVSGTLITSKYFITAAGLEWLRAYNKARPGRRSRRA